MRGPKSKMHDVSARAWQKQNSDERSCSFLACNGPASKSVVLSAMLRRMAARSVVPCANWQRRFQTSVTLFAMLRRMASKLVVPFANPQRRLEQSVVLFAIPRKLAAKSVVRFVNWQRRVEQSVVLLAISHKWWRKALYALQINIGVSNKVLYCSRFQ